MKTLLAALLTVVAVVLGGSAVAADAATAVLVVSPHGGMTIQDAVDALPADGGVVELRGGVFHQRVRLADVAHVTLRPYESEHAVVSGAGLTPPEGLSALVEISDSTDVTVEDLDLTGYRTSRLVAVPAGIYVHGHDAGVQLVGNHIHSLGNDNTTRGSFDINAHGIAVYGDDRAAPISDLTIQDNTIDHLKLGASETVVLNGNVAGWSVVGNDIHDVNNIAIDAIGFETTLPGADRYTERNRARDGVISDNVVARVRSRGNPSYWDGGWCNCADGIYVDGGTRISIEANTVTDNDIGIEVAAENARGNASHVTVTGNTVTGSLYVGITTGGYCDGTHACGGVRTGSSHDNAFLDNVLRDNNILDDGSPEVLVQYHAYRDTFQGNTITATDSDGVVYGTVPHSDSHANHSDHNTFAALGATPTFGWDGHDYPSFAAYRAATGQDAHSTAG